MDNETKSGWPYEPATHTGKIAAALAKAQLEMHNPKFDAVNPAFKSKFASLAAVRAAVVPVLAKFEIALAQELQTTERGIACITHLYHSSGERLTFGPCEIPATKDNAHGFGSAATYARRYSLMAACGVVGDEDDDANAVVASTPELITESQAADLEALIEEVGADRKNFLRYLKVDALSKLQAQHYDAAVKALEAKRAAA
jgi:hypothetical protein